MLSAGHDDGLGSDALNEDGRQDLEGDRLVADLAAAVGDAAPLLVRRVRVGEHGLVQSVPVACKRICPRDSHVMSG